MRLLNTYIRNKLIKAGFNKEVAEEIVELTKKYPPVVDFVDTSYSLDDIKELSKFFDSEDAPLISFVYDLEPEKRILIIKAYNSNSFALNPRTWKLILTIASKYDANILRITLDNVVKETPNYEFINLIRTAIDQNINLDNLNYFKDRKGKTR